MDFKRHGDLNFQEITKEQFEKLKANGTKIEHDTEIVLQHGETTGHRHVLTIPKKEVIDIVQLPDGGWAFKLSSEASITHEDHKKLTFKPTYYHMTREREVDHFSESVVRQVID